MRNILLSTSATLMLALAAPALAQSSPTGTADTASDLKAGAGQESQTDTQATKKKHPKGAENGAPSAPDATSTDPGASPNGNGASELGEGANTDTPTPPSSPQL